MGRIGRFIDNLNDEKRDRIIEATNWVEPNSGMWVDLEEPTCKCLVGHADNWTRDENDLQERGEVGITEDWSIVGAHYFPALCKRLGTEKAVTLCKARAAKNNCIDLTKPTEIPSQA